MILIIHFRTVLFVLCTTNVLLRQWLRCVSVCCLLCGVTDDIIPQPWGCRKSGPLCGAARINISNWSRSVLLLRKCMLIPQMLRYWLRIVVRPWTQPLVETSGGNPLDHGSSAPFLRWLDHGNFRFTWHLNSQWFASFLDSRIWSVLIWGSYAPGTAICFDGSRTFRHCLKLVAFY